MALLTAPALTWSSTILLGNAVVEKATAEFGIAREVEGRFRRDLEVPKSTYILHLRPQLGFTEPGHQKYALVSVQTEQGKHLKTIKDLIGRLALCSFQLKACVVTLAAAFQVFLK